MKTLTRPVHLAFVDRVNALASQSRARIDDFRATMLEIATTKRLHANSKTRLSAADLERELDRWASVIAAERLVLAALEEMV